MKVRGQDLIDFFAAWPPGPDAYHEDSGFGENEDGALCLTDDGITLGERIQPDLTYTVHAGYLGWQGSGPAPADFDEDFERVIKRWIKARTVTALVIEVPKAEVEAARALCKERGWKVR